jgi:hypothetical protein
MLRALRNSLPSALIFLALPTASIAQTVQLRNSDTAAELGPRGLLSVTDTASGSRINLAADEWSITIDEQTLRSQERKPVVRKTSDNEVTYSYDFSPCPITAIYAVRPEWHFVSKQLRVECAPQSKFILKKVSPWELKITSPVHSDFVPSVYVPHLGLSLEQSRTKLPGKDYGEFLRFDDSRGAFLTVQNPFLEVARAAQSVNISYSPEMEWQSSWGAFTTDIACVGAYRLTGIRNPREMTQEWHLAKPEQADGMDKAEVNALTDCVRAFLIDPAPDPISVLVGWTLNDYQIDVGTADGRDEYKRIIDTASELGIQTVLYAPGNSKTAERTQSSDTWGWEYVLWLGMGQQIRKNQWDPAKDPLPASVTEMLDHAKLKHIGLLAYVYPSIPYERDSSWIVRGGPGSHGDSFTEPKTKYATLTSRALQDYLIQQLTAFKRRTGIAGYSFDYDFLNLPGSSLSGSSSSYAQWFGWRRVIETLRREFPSIVIDGRQSYQMYGPWSWLAGSYPHPTGTDEQPESFKPYPDLHFDRVSADRTRYVNYWYRNYQFAPEEIIPGYATHQTERSRNLPTTNSKPPEPEMMYTRYRPRDWDYLGYRYSFLSSIATGGWNNVVDMIPARDPEEASHFSAADKAWIRKWLTWTVEHKDYLRHARTILEQPSLGHVDGMSAVVGDRGYLFLFNPNYKQLTAEFVLDENIGLTKREKYLLKEIYPFAGRILGKERSGRWNHGDTVRITLDGTSATVYEIVPATGLNSPVVFNAASSGETAPNATLNGTSLALGHVAGQPGTTESIGVLLPANQQVSNVTVNGKSLRLTQTGNYVETQVRFDGECFAQAQEVAVSRGPDGELSGTFAVPQRILDQLAARKRAWPIPWTQEDYESTWLAPERLLLFVQSADGKDSAAITATLDGKPLRFQPAYSSGRVDSPSFVGFYADLSGVVPDVRHTIKMRIDGMDPGLLHGIFFDNVEPQLTESIKP